MYQPSSCWMFQQGFKMCQGLFKVEINVGPLQRRHLARILQKRESLMAGGDNTSYTLNDIASAKVQIMCSCHSCSQLKLQGQNKSKQFSKTCWAPFQKLGQVLKTESAKKCIEIKKKHDFLYFTSKTKQNEIAESRLLNVRKAAKKPD